MRSRVGLLVLGLAAAVGFAVHMFRADMFRADTPPLAAEAALPSQACSSCDARHARLRSSEATHQEVQD